MSTLSRFRTVFVALLVSLACVRPAAAIDWTDIWWNPAESGWGVNFIQADNFIFATFFIYGPQQQPTWVTAQLTRDANGVWSGPLYATTGPYYGAPWNPAQVTTNQVGTATFVPNAGSATAGTLTYNVGTTSVSKQITRQTLKNTPMGGSYSGAVQSNFSGCNDPANNGPVSYFVNATVTQTVNGPIGLSFTTGGGPLSLTGNYIQEGLLYRIPNATYTNAAYASTTFTVTAQVTQVKVTAQGLEGIWTATVGPSFAGCVETAYFSILYLGT